MLMGADLLLQEHYKYKYSQFPVSLVNGNTFIILNIIHTLLCLAQ